MRDKTIDIYNSITNQVNESGGFLTIRHLFYRLVSKGVIPKSEAAYKQIIYHTCKMRKQGYLPYSVFADNTRLVRKVDSYDNLSDALTFWSKNYRRELWAKQRGYVELWSEKDAISNIVYGITDEYDVPLYVSRGFSSLTFLYNAAENIKWYNRHGKMVTIYYLGDHDPSGVKSADDIKKKLEDFGCTFYFQRLAVNEWQIKRYNLQTRPTKESKHSKNFEGESVEIDAMEPKVLQQIVREAIERHIDFSELENVRKAEALELETLQKIQLSMQ